MEKSESIVNIAKALIAFHKEAPMIKKSADNPYFKSKYADLASIIKEVEPILTKNGLTFTQLPSGQNELVTILMHESGEFIQSSYTMIPAKNDPQGLGSAITYQKRYALAAILGLKLEDEDDDGNAASGNTGSAPRSARPRPQAKPVPAFDATEYRLKLESTGTTEELGKVWSSLPPQAKAALAALKDELKEKYAKAKI